MNDVDYNYYMNRIEIKQKYISYNCNLLVIYIIFFEDFMDFKFVVKMNIIRMLSELLEFFKFQYNMSFLEWIFEKCGEYDLVEKC